MAILELNNVTKRYPKFTLNNVSFSVTPGSITGFIGRNGAGKTTTLKAIMRLISIDQGTVNVFGKSMAENELELKQNISFSLSNGVFFPRRTLLDIEKVTSKFYKTWNHDSFMHYLEIFNLDGNKKVGELSQGMNVKFQLALALSHEAKLIILDEPTSGLDPISRDEIIEIFRKIVKSKERAILFYTHITSDLEKCASDIVYIRDGNIIDATSKLNFMAKYCYVKGKIKDLKEADKSLLISFRDEDNDEFEGLSKKDNASKLEQKFHISEPTLEQIMIFEERGHANEKFII